MPTLDYFLSSDLMEPPDAEQHYTEKLVRLPNLSIYYEPIKTDNIAMTCAMSLACARMRRSFGQGSHYSNIYRNLIMYFPALRRKRPIVNLCS